MILQDNNRYSITEEEMSELKLFNLRLSDLLSSNNSIFILSTHGDSIKNAIKNKEYIVSIERENNLWKASTGNIVGFIGKGNQKLTITSRFCKTSSNSCDYFLHYLLSKVFAFNLNQLNSSVKDNYFLNLLFCIFPKFLNDALLQGVYKKYQVKSFNNDKFRGSVQLSKHLNCNIPNSGKIAYRYSELSFDNEVTQLIRHTIEYIKTKQLGKFFLNQSHVTRDNVMAIINATPSYKLQDRVKIIKKSVKLHYHPYYTNYIILQKLCYAILQNENIIYSENNNSFYGLLIDMSWLWEEYLATLLLPLEFKHPMNLKGKNKLFFGRKISNFDFSFQKNTDDYLHLNFNTFLHYPDFYYDKELINYPIILDAKYKKYSNKETLTPSPEDVNQMLTYLYGLMGKLAILIIPGDLYKGTLSAYYLSGWGLVSQARLIVKEFLVCDSFATDEDCLSSFQKSEENFIDFIRKAKKYVENT